MKNTVADLQNHFFTALERLNNEGLKGKDLKEEIARANAIKEVGKVMVDNARVALEAAQFADRTKLTLPRILDTTGVPALDSPKPVSG